MIDILRISNYSLLGIGKREAETFEGFMVVGVEYLCGSGLLNVGEVVGSVGEMK